MKEQIVVGFTAGTLFDMKEAEYIYENSKIEDKETNYRNFFKKMNENGEIFKQGPALGLYIALKKLQNSLPPDLITMRFGITSRFDTVHDGVTTLFSSLKYYLLDEGGKDLMPEYISLTSGDDQATSHKMQGADLVFTSSSLLAKEYYQNGVPAVHIPNISVMQNIEMYNKRNGNINIIFDFDGVIADPSSEMVYQAAKKIKGLKPIEEFQKNEIENIDIPMDLGPLGEFSKKLSVIVNYFQERKLKSEIIPYAPYLKTQILTARGEAAIFRVIKTLTINSIKVNKTDFASGREKYLALNMLNKEDINLFLEDSVVHVEGARKYSDHVLAGLVLNDYTTNSQILSKIEEKLKVKYGN